MAKGLREITSRIKSVKSTAQITRAMQLVASSKMKRAQDAALAGRDYGWLLADILDSALTAPSTTEQHTHPLVRQREVRARGILLITTDKGLCGALNANLYRRLGEIPPSAKFIAVGRKGAQYLARTGRTLLADFAISDRVHLAEVRTASEYLLSQYGNGTVDTLEILYPRFKNTLVQEPFLQSLLPLGSIHSTLAALRATRARADAATEDPREMSFEPDATSIFEELPALYFKHTLYHALLEAKASEHSARMVAMKSATDNAHKITENLTLEYNKARQSAITQEINEITAASLAR
ncbi:MAG: ATP synthase F1 subunit gamma [Puniceicoccales bacterium]|jgi:F-type H+-transporting ATPase subunit gamma|nr:ATP synthase F1 subunit gamma [Puniceicoccales bacterium]